MVRKITNFELRDAENGAIVRQGDNSLLHKGGKYYSSNDNGDWKELYVVDLDAAVDPVPGQAPDPTPDPAPVPQPVPTGADVSNASELAAAVQSAGTYRLAPGDYGQMPPLVDGVALVGADQNNKPVFGSRAFSGGSHLVFDNLTFHYKPSVGHNPSQPHLLFENCDTITVQNCNIVGDLWNDTGDPAQPMYNWGFGIVTRNCSDVIIDANVFRGFSKAIQPTDMFRFAITNNDIGHFGSDGISCAYIEDGLIDGNYIHDLEHQIPGAHGDLIQFFRGARRIRVSNNFGDCNKGLYSQGHHNKTDVVKEDVIMEDNVWILMHANGNTGGNWTRSALRRVLMVRNPNTLAEAGEPNGAGGDSLKGVWSPKIRVDGDIVVEDCTAPEIYLNNARIHGTNGNVRDEGDAAAVRAATRADPRFAHFFGV